MSTLYNKIVDFAALRLRENPAKKIEQNNPTEFQYNTEEYKASVTMKDDDSFYVMFRGDYGEGWGTRVNPQDVEWPTIREKFWCEDVDGNWASTEWNEPENYSLQEIIETDKWGHPTKAIFSHDK